MDVVFLGTPEFAVPSLKALVDAPGHRVVGVITQPDRPRGRGRKLTPPPIKSAAAAAGLPLHQAEDVNGEETLSWIRDRSPGIGVVVAFGQFLKKALRDLPSMGCINLHASILPKYRGAAPIHAAIQAGETETGVSIMRVEKRMDAGSVFARATTTIGIDESVGDLEPRLAEMGADLLVGVLEKMESGGARAEPQDESEATHVDRIAGADRQVDWCRPAAVIHNQVRGLTPHPGAVTTFEPRSGGTIPLRITRTTLAAPAPTSSKAGTVLGVEGRGIRISVQEGGLRVLRLIPAGGREMDAAEFMTGRGRGGGRLVGPTTKSDSLQADSFGHHHDPSDPRKGR